MTLQDIFTKNPALAGEWDAEKNTLPPETLTASARDKVWWRCGRGHSYDAAVHARAYLGRGCPYCAGQRPIVGETDLASAAPEVAALWDIAQNAPLTPQSVTAGSHKHVWWRCEKGHSWRAPVYSLTKSGGRCPYCAGKQVIPGETDVAAKMPELEKEWCADLTGALTPQMVSCGQKKLVWWRCELGHTYRAAIYSRAKEGGTGCPYCAGRKALPGFNDLATLVPEVAAQWHPALNGTLTPEQVTRGSKRQVWWRCGEGHVWKAPVYARTRKRASGCPVCAGTVKIKEQPRSRHTPTAAR